MWQPHKTPAGYSAHKQNRETMSDHNPGRPIAELRDVGFLWLINRVVFHPRGYALALHFSESDTNRRNCTGWSLLGDGTEPWSMADPPQPWPEGYVGEDELFARVEATFRSQAGADE